jgi:cytochrome c5
VKVLVSFRNRVVVLGLVASLAACSSESAETLADAHPGQSTYNEACISCHNPGISGAPRLGDADAWQPRAAKGRQALVASTVNGLNAMPAKGMCWQCSDEQLAHAVDYMLEQAGVTATP